MIRVGAAAVEPLPSSLVQVIVVVPTLQWVTTGYLLSMTMMIPVTGWAVDRFGARRMWMLAPLRVRAGLASPLTRPESRDATAERSHTDA